MVKTLKDIWLKISYNGIDENSNHRNPIELRNVFFNKVIFVGFFAILFHTAFCWQLLGIESLYFTILLLVCGISYILNRNNLFSVSKRLFILSVYFIGLLMTIKLGGDGLFHIGALSVFSCALIIFDFKKEKWEILVGIPFILFSVGIGEFELFGTPSFANNDFIIISRIMNILSLLFLNSILTLFILQLNRKNEQELSKTLTEKERLLTEIITKSLQLEESKVNLEQKIEARTFEIKIQNKQLEKQNKENVILLQEVHHRVKNNLQLIVSLINLQLSKFDDDKVEKELREIQGRVVSMSLVHKKMYQTSLFTEIGLKEYALQLIESIKKLYTSEDFDIKIDIPENVKFDIERATPIALILNEIVSNFFKHVFMEKDLKSKLQLTLTNASESHYVLKFADNGKGFEEGYTIQQSNSLGIELIDTLVQQVDGELKIHNDNGAVYEFTIKK